MKSGLVLAVCIILSIGVTAEKVRSGSKMLKMSTTTSLQISGLFDILLPELEKETGIGVKIIAKGTGAAIRDGIDGNVDLIFIHSKSREEKFVRDGYGTKRYPVMHNDFVILGPSSDPAGIKGMRDAVAAFEKIALIKIPFVSRGDDSGTHTKEQNLWEKTGLNLKKKVTYIRTKGIKREIGFLHPEGLGRWYLSIGQGMGKAMTFSEEKQAYILADRGTFIKYKHGRKQGLDLEVLCEGDPILANPYGVIPINPSRHPHVNHVLSKIFVEWVVSKRGQNIIANYRLHGKALFHPDGKVIFK